MDQSWLSRTYVSLCQAVDRRRGWHRLPRWVGIAVFVGLRRQLRRSNLFDTGPFRAEPELPMPPGGTRYRSVDGTFNDPSAPRMGSVGCRFGRNVPPSTYKTDDLLEPNPRVVSRELMTRDRFIPATTLNVLAAAWLQFEVHDWFSHGKNPADDPYLVPLEADDDWDERPMRIQRTRPDPTWDPAEGIPPTFRTAESHWWDGSQIYGRDPRWAARLRGDDGKLAIGNDGLPLPEVEADLDLADTAGAAWLGLGLLHVLFMREHNAICDALRAEYPQWSDDQLYGHARLINSALMAKIHTVEWTPAVIAHPTTELGMKINWWGIVGPRWKPQVARWSANDVIRGIPGSPTDHHGVPYALTEEFVAVYRMHPLLPDDFAFRAVADDAPMSTYDFPDIGVLHLRNRLEELGAANSLYSLGTAHPGAITLHNYPRFLQRFVRPIPADNPEGQVPVVDLAAVDIVRDRERGVPRYREFRRMFHLHPPQSFDELTPNRQWAREIRDVYEGEIDAVDLMVGLYAEPFPAGFGFSDTAFRVFMLMASRRLKSDRFFTTDYTPDVYSPLGLRWVEENTLSSVLRRHYPEVAPALEGVENAFTPWRHTGR